MTTLELNAWNSFLGVIQNFLKSHWSHDYLNFIESMLNQYGDIGTNMSIKIHFLHSHLDRFPGNCGAYSDEQGKHFHQDIMVIDRYQGLWNQRMIADDYWNVKRDTDGHSHSRNSRKRKFTLHMQSSFIFYSCSIIEYFVQLFLFFPIQSLYPIEFLCKVQELYMFMSSFQKILEFLYVQALKAEKFCYRGLK